MVNAEGTTGNTEKALARLDSLNAEYEKHESRIRQIAAEYDREVAELRQKMDGIMEEKRKLIARMSASR